MSKTLKHKPAAWHERVIPTPRGLLMGVWTPLAEVLCWPCHGPNRRGREGAVKDYETVCKPMPQTHVQEVGLTFCDKCGRRIDTNWPAVAAENNLLLELRRAFGGHPKIRDMKMAQTGGMCSAAAIYLRDGTYVYAFSSEEDADEDGQRFYLAHFVSEDDEQGRNLFEDKKKHHGTAEDVLERVALLLAFENPAAMTKPPEDDESQVRCGACDVLVPRERMTEKTTGRGGCFICVDCADKKKKTKSKKTAPAPAWEDRFMQA